MNHTAPDLPHEEKEEKVSDWVTSIKQQINLRDSIQKIPFESVSKSYTLLLDEHIDLDTKVVELSQALRQIKQDNWNKPSLYSSTILSNSNDNNSNQNDNNDSSNSSPDKPKKLSPFSKKNKKQNKNDDNNSNNNNNQPSSPMNYEVETLKNENDSLRKELMDVYRLKRENEEALSRLKKQTVEHEELIMQRGKSLDELSYKHNDLLNAHQELKEENEILKSGLNILNSESVELRKAHDNGIKELDRFKDENRRLTEQLLKMKESQMDQLHEWQQEFEKFRKINAAKLGRNDGNLGSNFPFGNDDSRYPSLSVSTQYPNYHQQREKEQHKRRHTVMQSSSVSPPQTVNRKWSISSFLFGKKDEEQKTNTNDNNKNGRNKMSQSVDFSSHRAPIVDLYGPSLFNVTPPQLKSKMWQAHADDISAMQFDASGKKLISGGNDKLVKIWQASTGQEIGTLRGCTSSIICTKYSPNYAFICAGGNDCQLHLWNVRTQRQIRVYNGHANKITSLSFTRDSRLIYSGSTDRTIKLWDLETAACRYTMSAHSSVYDLAISPDEYYIGSAHLDGNIRFWSRRDKKELFKLSDHQPQQTIGIQFSPPDGIQILTASKDGKIIIWDLRKQQKLHEIDNIEYKNTFLTGKPCYSPDGQYILAGSSIKSKKINQKYSLFIWKTKNAKLQHTLTEHTQPITKVIWNGRGGVASADRSGHIAMWC